MFVRNENAVLPFRDRAEAGRILATKLRHYADKPDAIILALPRGGVPVAFEVAQALHLPMEVFVVRKLGVPGQRELAMGAIASGGVRVINTGIVQALGISRETIDMVARQEQQELERRERVYREGHSMPDVRGRTVLLVDDGIATGATIQAAVQALRALQAARVVVAVPVAPAEATALLRQRADEVVCVAQPEPFFAIGQWYENFPQLGDENVRALLTQAHASAEKAA
jgi:predicted phosphoribosyltransferase